MDKIIKNQPDWDDVINKNFAKFKQEGYTDDVIYLNGTAKDDKQSPLWYRCLHLGETNLVEAEGFIKTPNLAPGQTIDIVNLPGVTGHIKTVVSQNVYGGRDNVPILSKSNNPGTLNLTNYSTSDTGVWQMGYSILAVYDND